MYSLSQKALLQTTFILPLQCYSWSCYCGSPNAIALYVPHWWSCLCKHAE